MNCGLFTDRWRPVTVQEIEKVWGKYIAAQNQIEKPIPAPQALHQETEGQNK